MIVSHSWPIGGYGTEPGLGTESVGAWSVAGFFAISGYLITMSRVRSRTLVDYAWRRFLRIYPGYLTVLIVTAFVFAPVSVLLFHDGVFQVDSAVTYVLKNITVHIGTFVIPGTLTTVPYPDAWNGALWTLSLELFCYVGIGLLVTIVPRKALPYATAFVFVVCTIVAAMPALGPAMQLNGHFGSIFAAGALLYLWRERIPMSSVLAVAAAVLFVVTLLTETFGPLGAAPAAYLMLWLGARLPFTRVGARNDISYGMYIYGFPVQQLLVHVVPHQVLPVWLFALLGVLLTVPFAAASWLLVERPAMKLKRLTARRSVDREGHVEGSNKQIPI